MKPVWGTALQRLSERIAPQNFDMWLRPIECIACSANLLKLRAPNPYVRLWFESNYLSIVLEEIRSETGADYNVEFLNESATATSGNQALAQTGTPTGQESALHAKAEHGGEVAPAGLAPVEQELLATQGTPNNPPGYRQATAAVPPPAPEPVPTHRHHGSDGGMLASSAHGAHAQSSMGQGISVAPVRTRSNRETGNAYNSNIPLNPRYNFDTFVAGPSNQLAYAAAQAAANTYPPKYNPIFVCGGVGLGKTHLLHAIGHHMIKQRPGTRLLYLSGEQFMNEYIHAIRTNKMHEFRRRYREGCDVLLVDDVQFLAGKDGTQDEFFHTFNALHETHRQIVLTADRKPHEISDIADRLKTRFAWGLLADIEPPELEVRVAILRKKAAAENIYLPDDVALYIATAIKSNVRELEGALIRLAAYASLSRQKITMEFAKQTLEGSITRAPEQLSVDHILKAVASYYSVKISDLKSPRRHKSIAGPRAVAMYLARQHTNESYPDLGRSFGGKHHTTVISAVEKITKRLKEDAGLRGELHAVESLLLR